MGLDLTMNPMAKIVHNIVYSFNFETVKAIYMESIDAYIECYKQFIYGSLDMVLGYIPSFGKLLNI